MKKKLFVVALCALLFTGCSFEKKEETKDNNKEEVKEEEKIEIKEDINDNQNPIVVVDGEPYTSICRSNTGNVDVDTSKYSNIYDYILEQDDVKVVVSYFDENLNEIKKELTDEQINNFFNNMKAGSIDAVYGGGFGGAYVSTISISYVRNGISRNVNIYQIYTISSSTDMNIYKIIDEHAEKIVNDERSTDCNYYIKNFDESVYEIVKQ